jgi:hypothetical protein
MTLLRVNFLTLILKSHFERARILGHKTVAGSQSAASEKGESHHERIPYGICIYKSRLE